MEHALLVTVRFHEGRYHGLDNRKASEWPPAPARLFQALMAGAARGATVPGEVRAALEWLEALPPPVIAAPRDIPGQAFTSYVPNNDLDAELAKGKAPDLGKAVAAIRVGKRFRPILFDAGMPILYCWPFGDGDGDGQAKALCEAANGLYQLGRGIDMAWAEAAVIDPEEAEQRLSGHGGIVYRPSGGGNSDLQLLCPRPVCGGVWPRASKACAPVSAPVEPTASRSACSCSRPSLGWPGSSMTRDRIDSSSSCERLTHRRTSPARR